MKRKKFVTCINCIDGRTEEPAIAFLKEKFSADYVDLITEPGPDALLAAYTNRILIGSIKRRVKISLEKHNSSIIAVAGHYNCAANPVNKIRHLEQIKESVRRVNSWGFGVLVLGLWINKKFNVSTAC